jgi:CubicO group peptidase (beta-lactamase class C family)
MTAFEAARRIVDEAIGARIFPAAALEVGDSGAPIWGDALGTLTFESDAPANLDTPFDLASLTKVIATTTVVMELVRTGALSLDEPVSAFFTDWRGTDRDAVTILDLLEHASGLPARLVDPPPATQREFEHEIATIRLECDPRSRAIYSDLGFILLAFAAADRGSAPLSELFENVAVRLTPDATSTAGGARHVRPEADAELTFALSPALRTIAAPTHPMKGDPRCGRTLVGEVHDNYAAALGGVAGHAGLFGPARAVGVFARAMLRAARGDVSVPRPFTPELVARFTTKSTVPDSSRALGWDTMLPTSSCGTRMSPRAFGHVGFTGTSLWIDPVRDRYFVLLTNRVAGGGTIEDMRTVRRAFHDALGDA